MKLKLIFLAFFIPFFSTGQHSKTDSLLLILKKSGNNKKAEIYLKLAKHTIDDSPGLSKKYILLADSFAVISDNKPVIVDAQFLLAENYLKNEKLDSAAHYFNKCTDLFEQQKRYKELIKTYDRIGKAEFLQSNYPNALKAFFKQLKYEEKYGEEKDLAGIYSNIGGIYIKTNEIDKGIEMTEKAIEINKRFKRFDWLSVNYNNLGECYREKGEIDKSLTYYSKSISICDSIGFLEGKFNATTNMANLFIRQQKHIKAKEYLEKSLGIAQTINYKYGQASALINLGIVLNKLGKHKESIKAYKKGYKIASEINALEWQKNAAFNLVSAIAKKNNQSELLDYLNTYDQLNDSLFKKEKTRQIRELRIEYETAQKEKENLLLKKENELQNNKIKLRERQIILSILILFTSIIAIILLIRTLRLKHKALSQKEKIIAQEKEIKEHILTQKEMEKEHIKDIYEADIKLKNAEISTATLEIISKNEILKKLKKSFNDGNHHQAIKIIHKNIDPEQNWHKFRFTFEKVYPDFFMKLKKKYPELTENETKLSAFLLMNLKTSEIAEIMNISEASASKYRNRLRKKLNLAPFTDLNEYFKQYF